MDQSNADRYVGITQNPAELSALARELHATRRWACIRGLVCTGNLRTGQDFRLPGEPHPVGKLRTQSN